MGTTKSKEQDLAENGVVNSNFIVEENITKPTSEVKILLYIITIVVVLKFLLHLYKMQRRNVKRNITRSMANINSV